MKKLYQALLVMSKALSNEKRTFFVAIAKHPNCGQP